MKRLYATVLYSALLISSFLSAADKSSVCPESGNVAAALGVLGSVAAAVAVKKAYDQKERLAQENHALQTQATALGVTLAVCQQRDEQPHEHCYREHSRLQQANESLEKQNRLLAEFCPLLKEAAQQEFRCGCDPDVIASWGCE